MKLRRITLLFIIVAILLAPTPVLSRVFDKTFALTGTVVSLQTYCHEGYEPMAQVELSMQFRNDGREPIVVVPPNLLFDRNVNFSTAFANASKIATKSRVYNPYFDDDPFRSAISSQDYDYRKNLFQRITTSPQVIEPSGYWEFRDVLLLTSGFEFDPKLVKNRPAVCKNAPAPIPEFQYLSVDYLLSSKHEPTGDNDIFRKLAIRWKTLGVFAPEENGNIFYRSQPIILVARNPS